MQKDPSLFLNKAKAIMHKTDAQLGSPMKRKTNSQGEYDDALMFENTLYQTPQNFNNYELQQFQQTGQLTEASKNLPGGIFESMMNNPINTDQQALSVLDTIMPNMANIQTQQQRIPINEDFYGEEKEMPTVEDMYRRKQPNITPQQQYNYQQQPPQGQNIDYSMIRMIMKECVSEEIKKLQKIMVNSMLINLGKEMQIVDSSGNIFKGTLKKIGNIKDK